MTVPHLGDLNRVPTQTEVEALGPVTCGAGAGRRRRQPECRQGRRSDQPAGTEYRHPHALCHPRLTLLKLDPLSKFLKEMGLSERGNRSLRLKITSASSLPEETQVVVLDYQHS